MALALLSLASVSGKTSAYSYHTELARANARVALSEALSQLQLTLGRDQTVCANASLFETHDDPSTSEDESIHVANRHWLGAWDCTVDWRDERWPVVGKKGDSLNIH